MVSLQWNLQLPTKSIIFFRKVKKMQQHLHFIWKVVYVDAASINLNTIHDFIISVSCDLV